MKPAIEPTKPRGSSRRFAIIRRATEIFGQKGYAQTTLEDIATSVGVTREAIYYHFRDKAELLYEIIKPESEALAEGIERLMALQMPAREKLVLAIEHHLLRFNPGYPEMVIAHRELMKADIDSKIALLRPIWKAYEQHWVDLVRAGQAEGDFPADLDPKLAAFAILGMCNSPSTWFDPARGVSIAELSSTLVRLALGGILIKHSPPEPQP